MKVRRKSKSAIGLGTIIGLVVCVLLAIFLLNPRWLPVSEEIRSKIVELEKTHFLIERSGRITTAHILTLLLAMAVLWVLYTVLKLILTNVGK